MATQPGPAGSVRRTPHLRVVVTPEPEDFSDLGDLDNMGTAAGDVEGGAAVLSGEAYKPISLDDAVDELAQCIDEAIDFRNSEFMDEWEDAEAFFDGKSDVPKQDGRSQVTKTTFRDAVRALKPSAMRVFTQAEHVVEYDAVAVEDAVAGQVAWQQTAFINQLFWKNGGYLVLNSAFHNSAVKKYGVMKACYSPDYKDEYITATNVPEEALELIESQPAARIIDVTDGEYGYNVEVAIRKEGGKISLDHVPAHEFFISDSATGVHDGEVIGQSRNETVGYARSLGLEHPDWYSLDAYDPETNEGTGESERRRGYVKDNDDQRQSMDPSKHKFLLTEAYAYFDLDGTGIPQLYRFWLGGSFYDYIDHERVEENPYAIGQIDPMPDTFAGRSVFDILREDQNTQTSLLRATCDNAHLANNVRLAYNERLVNPKDIVNTKLGAPIRFKQPGQIQEIGVQSTVGAMLPLMTYLEETSETKVGVTKASYGLDSDALQSTDKEAVRNTIMLSQGQVEYMVRNFTETGLRVIFDKMLRLSLRHNPRQQVIQTINGPIPVDQYAFTPDAPMHTAVGLGQPDQQTTLAGLHEVAAKQKEVIAMYGLNNPICNAQQHFNAILDIGRIMGLRNMTRYFNPITPQVSQQLDAIMKQQQQEAQNEKPSDAIVAGETVKAQARIQEQMLENQQSDKENASDRTLKIAELLMRDDLERDKLRVQAEIADEKSVMEVADRAAKHTDVTRGQRLDVAKFLMQQMAAAQQPAQSGGGTNAGNA